MTQTVTAPGCTRGAVAASSTERDTAVCVQMDQPACLGRSRDQLHALLDSSTT